jgi:hypothetical protein
MNPVGTGCGQKDCLTSPVLNPEEKKNLVVKTSGARVKDGGDIH